MAPAPLRYGQRRLTEEDKMKMFRSRWALIAAGARCFPASLQPGSPTGNPRLATRQNSEPALSSAHRGSHIDEEMEQVKGVLEQILPARKQHPVAGFPRRNHSDAALPQLMQPPAVAGLGTGLENRGTLSPGSEALSRPASRTGEGGGLNLEGTGKFQNQILERFRQQLLRRFLSLHDAFERLNHNVSRDRALTHTEFRNALERLGVGEQDSKAIFTAMDSHSVGGVTLSEFLHALVDVSPEALLWELRCRLIRFDIGTHTLNKALELVKWPQHGWLSRATKVKRRTTRRSSRGCCACAACARSGIECSHSGAVREGSSPSKGRRYTDPLNGVPQGHESASMAVNEELASALDETSPKGRSVSCHFSRGDWLKLCTSMYLTLLESERLFKYLVDPEKGTVDLRTMFETLRTTVEPDVPLERFVTKAVVRYDSLENAFNAFSEDLDSISDEERVMRWQGFYSLAVALNVNDRCASELWNVLSRSNLMYGRMSELKAAGGAAFGDYDEDGEQAVTKEVFLHELSLWAPDTALGDLKGQLCERFGSLAEGQRALEQQLPQKEDLSPLELEARLRAAGIKHCDIEGALRTVASKDGSVSLEAAISTMRAIRPRSSRLPSKLSDGARSAVRNQTQPLWEQLREVQTDMRRGMSWSAAGGDGSGASVGKDFSPPNSPPKVDRRKFTEAIHGAVKSADSTRSRSVLHHAHRQVLKLEERWAGMPLSPSASNTTPGRARHSSVSGPPPSPGGAPAWAGMSRRQTSPAVLVVSVAEAA
uniref:EF-hand domain-containing protein n=1 Tax=Alexandrium monilatum TaxID=311494 RepID=A0A7S4Q2L5_9DINO